MRSARADLQAALAQAVRAALPLAHDKRPAFIRAHLLAQADGASPPVAEGSRTNTREEMLSELANLAAFLTRVVNVARAQPGWPLRAVANVLATSALPAAAPTAAPAVPPAAAPAAVAPASALAAVTPSEVAPTEGGTLVASKPITKGWDAQANKPKVIGYAPLAKRPKWLPKTGPGQKNVTDPTCWSLTVDQWQRFVRACRITTTWKALVDAKGDEYEITMYDVCEHFVKPWTAGTGSSIALLMNTQEQRPAEGMFSHAWAGSVMETLKCLQNAVSLSGVPLRARFFFCTFSMYQPAGERDSASGELADGSAAHGGLTISEQIEQYDPFAKIIESRPKYGMYVLHTTLSEVYERLWVAFEADAGTDAGLAMNGLFDVDRWKLEQARQAWGAVQTRNGKCGVDKDRAFIESRIKDGVCKGDLQAGYERLDGVVATFRSKMQGQLPKFAHALGSEDTSGATAVMTEYESAAFNMSAFCDTLKFLEGDSPMGMPSQAHVAGARKIQAHARGKQGRRHQAKSKPMARWR